MRHYIAFTRAGGEIELHRMKEWLREHPEVLPSSADPWTQTSRQLRSALRRKGWLMREGDEDVRLFPPDDPEAVEVRESVPALEDEKAPRASSSRERAWVRDLVPRVQAALAAVEPALEVRDGYRLAYSREILSYHGTEPEREAGMRYETDLLVVEHTPKGWTPRVVIEAKLRSVTTHDAITYSQKAATHKHVHPYLRYGIFLGERAHHPLPGRLFRHGAQFDFMVSWRALEPSAEEFETFTALLVDEVRASRLLQEIMFNTRARGRVGYTLLQKPVIAR